MKLQILFFVLVATNAGAVEFVGSVANPQDETIVFGEAKQPDGTFDEVFVEQPQNVPNPLGTPFYDENTQSVPFSSVSTAVAPFVQPVVEQNSMQNPSISQMSPQTMGEEIQNKLYQSGERIYDVQSYPAADIKYINQNNQDNAITNYPAY